LLVIVESEPNTVLSKTLINDLSEILKSITGSDGRGSFRDWEPNPRAIFVIALQGEESVGCGALRPINLETAEVKRMYAKYQDKGIGKEILRYLEKFARVSEYKKIWLETRVVNDNACKFYLKNGYTRIENYGQYIGREECACFEKVLIN
jgi:ribosomal protein S18 acetylase RimI-like enzyme